MNNDKIKGKAKDIAGRAERQVGEWTGNNKAQAEGLGKQIEGKAQNAWGKVKDAGKDLKHGMDRDVKDKDRELDADVEQQDEARGVHGVRRGKNAA